MPTITQARSSAARPSSWSGSVSLDQVDPALGVSNLTLSLTGSLYSSAAVENLEASAANFSSFDQGSLTLDRPDGTALLVAGPSTGLGGRLAAYDGTIDGAGASGAVFQSSFSSTVSATYGTAAAPSPDAGLLLGTGTVTLPVVASARVNVVAPGNFTAEFASDIAATVSTSATYGTGSPTFLGQAVGVVSDALNAVATPVAAFASGIQVRQQVVTIAEAATGTNGTVSVAGLDPSLGTLVGVDVDLLAYANGTAAVENLDPVAGILGISQAADLALTRADGTGLVSASPGLSVSTVLAGSDGTMDFAGASGADLALRAAAPGSRTGLTLSGGGSSVLAMQGTNDVLFTDASTLAAFTGAGSVTLDANRAGVTAVSGPGNLAVDVSLWTGGAAVVTYLYAPAAAGVLPVS